jgi:hypothetical protein
MTGFEIGVIAVFVAVAIWCTGAVFGAGAEGKAWKLRALDEKGFGTAHYFDGAFYYIVPEPVFLTEFQRRKGSK